MSNDNNKKKQPVFNVDISGYLTLTVDEIWPDGDAPENPTVEDVARVIEDCGGLRDVLRDWSLDDGLTMDIRADGKRVTVYS